MANITGTNGIDTLTGTSVSGSSSDANDRILSLGGNDLIIGTNGEDFIDGGAGYDTLDYSTLASTVAGGIQGIGFTGDRVIKSIDNVPVSLSDTVVNIERVIAPVIGKGAITISSEGVERTLDVDLSQERMRVTSLTGVSRTYSIKNFNSVFTVAGSSGLVPIFNVVNSRIVGSNGDDSITMGNGSNVIIGSKGNDYINVSTSNQDNNTRDSYLDYSNLGQAVRFVFAKSDSVLNSVSSFNGTINKGRFGKDSISSFQNIIGASNQNNAIDMSTIDTFDEYGVEMNLAKNSLKFNYNSSTFSSDPSCGLTDFVDAIGTKYNDRIIGSNKNGKLTGGGGNDTITGCDGI